MGITARAIDKRRAFIEEPEAQARDTQDSRPLRSAYPIRREPLDCAAQRRF